jgi:hypothetical protein
MARANRDSHESLASKVSYWCVHSNELLGAASKNKIHYQRASYERNSKDYKPDGQKWCY